jgi:hypothetical protein
METTPDMSTVAIPLGESGCVALVDAADAAAVSAWRWRCLTTQGKQYAVRKYREDGVQRVVLMHRELMNLQRSPGPTKSDRLEVDHINGDGLDNRRKNLRVVTHAQNAQNRRGSARGVYRKKGRWCAVQRLGGVAYHLGYFTSKEEAVAVVRQWRASNAPYSAEALSA